MKKENGGKGALLALALLCAALSAHGLEWPLPRPEILSLFGQRTEGGIERGIVMEGESAMRAAGDGIVIATISESRNMSGFPSALGNALILAHSDGIVSVYGNLDSLSMLEGKEEIETNAVIARTGKSAWQGRRAEGQEGGLRGICIFQLMDQRQNALLNPLLLLSPLGDTVLPIIRSVRLESQSGEMHNLAASQSIAGGQYRVLVSVADSFESNSQPQLAPFRVSVIVNGAESSAMSFETMEKKRNMIVPNSLPEYLDGSAPLYSENGEIYAGNIFLSRGRAEIIVAARDFAGNERTASFMLQAE